MQIGYDVEFSQRDASGKLAFPESRRSTAYEVTRDGLLNEVRSKTQYWCREQMIEDINLFKRWIQRQAKRGIVTDFNDIVYFRNDEWNEIPRSYKILGCAPDGCIYPEHIDHSTWQDYPMRVSGGHIHIGIHNGFYNDKTHKYERRDIWKESKNWHDGERALKSHINFIKNLDATVALSNVIYNRRNEAERRRMYGTAGSYRKKPYGLEYRVLDNSWILHNWSISLTVGLVKCVTNMMIGDPSTCLVENNEISELRKIIDQDRYHEAKDMFPEMLDRVPREFFYELMAKDRLNKLHQYLYKNPILPGQGPTIEHCEYGIGEFYRDHSHLM